MSDMMPGMPQQGPKSPLAKPSAITNNMSVSNPADLAMMSQSGTINTKMTVKEWVENVLKIPINAPVTELIGALKSQMQNGSVAGKAKSMGQQARPQSAPMQGQRAPMPQKPAPSAPQGGGGVSGLMNAMRG